MIACTVGPLVDATVFQDSVVRQIHRLQPLSTLYLSRAARVYIKLCK